MAAKKDCSRILHHIEEFDYFIVPYPVSFLVKGIIKKENLEKKI
jgi:hypothetical protein